jgi:exoribonuclease R
VLWRFRVAEDGSLLSVDVRRALVRSTAQLDYISVQAAADAGSLPEPIAALPQVGRALLDAARRRHAIDIDLPEQIVVPVPGGGWTLQARAEVDVERWNAQLSLLTGMAAARLMLDAGVGVLRTVPPPDAATVESLRGAARALGVSWPPDAAPGDVLAGLDRSDPRALALIDHAAALLRGAAYTPFDGAPPEQRQHGGIGAPYAHVTAPLRRLVDRFGSEVCLAAAAGEEVPDWCRSALTSLPALMQRADRLAHEADRAVVDATEAWLLHDRVGEVFDVLVIDAAASSGTVVLDEPAVRARCDGAGLPVGGRIRARLAEADVAARRVRFTATDGTGAG